jgi:Protein of unknown function (DUF5132)
MRFAFAESTRLAAAARLDEEDHPPMDEVLEVVSGRSFWGLAVAAVAGVAIVSGRGAKPLAKTAIKGFLGGREWLRERLAESTEGLQDLYAEARFEYQSEVGREGTEPQGEGAAKRRRQRAAAPAEAPASA